MRQGRGEGDRWVEADIIDQSISLFGSDRAQGDTSHQHLQQLVQCQHAAVAQSDQGCAASTGSAHFRGLRGQLGVRSDPYC